MCSVPSVCLPPPSPSDVSCADPSPAPVSSPSRKTFPQSPSVALQPCQDKQPPTLFSTNKARARLDYRPATLQSLFRRLGGEYLQTLRKLLLRPSDAERDLKAAVMVPALCRKKPLIVNEKTLNNPLDYKIVTVFGPVL